MADDPSSEWPSYRIGQRDHLHALGVITAAYNLLEFILFVHFMRFLGLDPKPAQRIFVLLPNPERVKLLRTAVIDAESNPIVRDRVLHFIEGFEILVESRNFLAHSHTILNTPEQEHLTFGKGSKRQPDLWSFAHLKVEDLRRIADDIHSFQIYGSHLDAWIVARRSGGRLDFGPARSRVPPLPEMPPLPEKLTTGPRGILE